MTTLPQILVEQAQQTHDILTGYLEDAEKIAKGYKKACETEVALPTIDVEVADIQKECKEGIKISASLSKMIAVSCFHLESLYSSWRSIGSW